MPFDSPDVPLSELVQRTSSGKLQLPDFQREWKWDTDRIKGLLASIAQGFPVGVMMMLEVGGEHVSFAPRPIAGVDSNGLGNPEWLVLDGQQRMTSLYQSLHMKKAVDTTDARGKRLKRWYYIDMQAALAADADIEEAVVDVPEDRIQRTIGNEIVVDYSSRQKECDACVFPLSIAFEPPEVFAWQNAFVSNDDTYQVGRRLHLWNEFFTKVLNNLITYTVPVIVLKKETPKEAVCTVFEKVNTGGMVLNVFELLTATFAAHGFKLNEDWKARKQRLDGHAALTGVEDTDFLQAICLLASRERRRVHLESGADPQQAPGVTCKRKDILNLTREDYERWAQPVEDALLWAAQFLAKEAVFQARDVPYKTQLVPLAAIRVVLASEADNLGVAERLRQWYWCGVLGELYGGTTETRFARDLVDVEAWVTGGGGLPRTVQEASFNSGRLMTLKTRNSAAYKGIYALIMRGGCHDWLQDQPINLAVFFSYQLDIHHIFPKKWCSDHGIDATRRESIVNKTAISAKTNRIIGRHAPSTYLPALQRRAGITPARIDEILDSHIVPAAHLRTDAFTEFFDTRKQGLLTLIGNAMGKPPVLDAEDLEAPDEFEPEADDVDVIESMQVVEEAS